MILFRQMPEFCAELLHHKTLRWQNYTIWNATIQNSTNLSTSFINVSHALSISSLLLATKTCWKLFFCLYCHRCFNGITHRGRVISRPDRRVAGTQQDWSDDTRQFYAQFSDVVGEVIKLVIKAIIIWRNFEIKIVIFIDAVVNDWMVCLMDAGSCFYNSSTLVDLWDICEYILERFNMFLVWQIWQIFLKNMYFKRYRFIFFVIVAPF